MRAPKRDDRNSCRLSAFILTACRYAAVILLMQEDGPSVDEVKVDGYGLW